MPVSPSAAVATTGHLDVLAAAATLSSTRRKRAPAAPTVEDMEERAAKIRRVVSTDDTSRLGSFCLARSEARHKEDVPVVKPTPDPTGILLTLLKCKHRGVAFCTHRAANLQDFFYKPTSEDCEAISVPLLRAVAEGDLETLKRLRQEGVRLNCFNKAGESLLHKACRKGQTEIVRYLVQEAAVPVNTCDEYGRTPMHDACWTDAPNFDIMEILLQQCPDLLLITDQRGHAPLRYARQEHWKTWVRFLAKKFHLVKPKFLHQN